jgi:hypothetical protein
MKNPTPMTIPFDGWVEFDAEHWEKPPTQPWELRVINGRAEWEPCTEEDITRALEYLDEVA